jgi:hypothetical protein
MMSDVERHASEAGLDRLLRHTAGIVNGVRIVGTIPATGKPADEEQPGTGCFVRWGNHHLIVTARHVVENARIEDLRVFAYPSGGFKVKPSVEVTQKDIVEAVRLNRRSTVIYSCAWEDLAVLTLDPQDFPGAEFVDIAKDRTDPLEGEWISCCGFPSDCHVAVNKSLSGDREMVDHCCPGKLLQVEHKHRRFSVMRAFWR